MSTPKILSYARRRSFDDVPVLSKEERDVYLTPDIKTRQLLSTFKSPENKVGYLLQRAYFQAKGRFFNVELFRSIDKKDIERSQGIPSCDLSQYKPQTASHHKKLILDSYGWKPYTDSERQALKAQALLLVDVNLSSENVLFKLLDHCWEYKIEIPSYLEFAGIVSESFNRYRQTVLERVEQHMTQDQMAALLSLLDSPDVGLGLTRIKRIDQAHTQRVLNFNADLLILFRDTFLSVKSLLDRVQLTPQAVQHFADWIYKATITQIRQLRNTTASCLHLASFVQDQFFLRQDYAVDAFLKVMRAMGNKARGYDRKQKEKIEQSLAEASQSVLNAAKSSQQILKLIIDIAKNPTFSLAERNEKVIHLAESFFEAENPSLVAHMQRVENNIANNDLKINFHRHLFENAHSLQKALSPLIRVLMFDEKNSNPALIKAIRYFASDFSEINDKTPTEFLSKKDFGIVFSDDGIPVITKYKIMLFIYIENALRNRSLTLEYSYRYRTYRHYMIPDEQWGERKEEFISGARLESYVDGPRVLREMGLDLTSTWKRVNDNVHKDRNPYLSVDNAGKWYLKGSEPNYDASKYIPGLLDDKKKIALYELLAEIDSYTQFSDSFTHAFGKQVDKPKSKKMIYATLMSLGTNLGHTDMAKAAKNITEKQLRDTERLWFSVDNILKANKCIVDIIQELPLPTIFNDQEDKIHTSSDGKKIVVAVNSLLANFSYKYYAKEQGISVNNFLDEKQSFFHVNVLTSSDREAAHMMDGIVKTKATQFHEGDADHMHSTDTHGYTEAIFAGLHFLGVSFAPRIANMNEQTLYAYEAKSLRRNSKNPIAPKTLINRKLILDNWDDILRLMASIKLGRCSASLIFRILSSSDRDNALYRAIKELGRLIKTKFILTYMDDETLRKAIQKQLNRVELGQRLSDAVFFGRNGQLQVGTADEMQRVMACKTLLKNAIILWNYLYLSDYLVGLENKAERKFVLESISKGSVIAWAHVNMHGSYDFDHKLMYTFKATLKQMMSIRVDI